MDILRDDTSIQTPGILAARADFVPPRSNTEIEAGQVADLMKIPIPDQSSLQDNQVDWQTAMKRAIRSSSELRRRLGLSEAPGSDSVVSAENSFATFVPLEFLRKMQPGDDRDPLLLQVLASANESIEHASFVADPVGDLASLADHGILHKYDGRALIVTTGACAVHCRYCFRREFPYHDAGARPGNWHHAIRYISSHPEIEEVLLSGGDPLTIADTSLFQLIDGLESISHVRRLRIHSRMPIVIPQRLTNTFIQRLSQSRLACWLVVHANHPREICGAVLERLECVVDHGIPVLNQSVLLRDINDNVDTLVELSRVLINHRLQPYYLHQLDPVRGAVHFEVPVTRGRELVAEMRSRLPGYAVPMYVAEFAGQSSKTPLEIASHLGSE